MPLQPATRVGPYEILPPLGDGSASAASLGLGVFSLLRNDIDAAADFMTRAMGEQYPGVLFFLNSSTGATRRASPRWPAMTRMLNLPEAPA